MTGRLTLAVAFVFCAGITLSLPASLVQASDARGNASAVRIEPARVQLYEGGWTQQLLVSGRDEHGCECDRTTASHNFSFFIAESRPRAWWCRDSGDEKREIVSAGETMRKLPTH